MEILKIIIFSGFFVFLGTLVWKKNVIDFIAGFKKDSFNNPNQLAKNIGVIIILYGLEIGILMLINLGNINIPPIIIGILAIVHIIAILLCYVYDMKQHKNLN